MKWTEKKLDIVISPLSTLLNGKSMLSALELITSSASCPHIFLSKKARTTIIKHVNANKTESGGLLIGKVISLENLNNGIVALMITQAVPSDDFHATSVSLSMGTEVWNKARLCSDASNFVIGWYHSHPNLGAFFSGTDRKTQAEFFNQNFHIGFVIDPIRHEECWFIGADSRSIANEYIWEIDANEFI